MDFMHYLSDINGVSIYPIISLVIFFAFFIGLFVWVRRLDKTKVEELKNIPLQEKENDSFNLIKIKRDEKHIN